jgi:hypothetical protein
MHSLKKIPYALILQRFSPALNPSSPRRRLCELEAAGGGKLDTSPLTGAAGWGCKDDLIYQQRNRNHK